MKNISHRQKSGFQQKNVLFRQRMRSGSALLIAILVMGVLFVLTLGLSDLVVREIHQTQDVVAAGKAYFAAEAGIENAMLDLHENLPGFEIQEYKDVQSVPGEDALHYRYRILNTADKIPYFDKGKAIYLNPTDAATGGALVPVSSDAIYDVRPDATYNVLGLNQSVVIPLSSQSGDIQDFLIEYYFKFDPENPLITDELAKNLDVLRWKIYGYPKGGVESESKRTDAISDFFPASKESNERKPMCIGTDQSLVNENKMSLAQDNFCYWPELAQDSDNRSSAGIASSDETPSSSFWGAARTCYKSDADSASQDASLASAIQTAPEGGCNIKNFIEHHTQNYLVLINYVNPDVIGLTDVDRNAGKANIYYRIVTRPRTGADDTTTPQLVRESAAISADGFASNGKIRQSIDANVGLSSFLPVFHFSLYRTDSTKDDK